MAREVFILGYGDDLSPEVQAQAIDNWNKKLTLLGVGRLRDVKPVVFTPPDSPYIDVAGQLIPDKDPTIEELDLLKTWEVPFVNKIQAAACILGGRAYRMHCQEMERSRHEQHIVVVQKAISDDFLRVNPSSMFAEVSNQNPKEPMFTSVIRDVSPRSISHR